ncbi:MAG: signal peptide peptidase SppA [Deltaproteobacteria bacterium]|nr:MAG: signal peptide peptidase SppA [Deltaproteobacteria bacterium]
MSDSRGRRIAVGVLAGVGALTILALLAAGAWYWKDKASVPERLVLEVDFERGVVENVPDEPVGRYLLKRFLVLRDVTEALNRAAEDRRVVGLVARVGASGMGMAQIQEIRDAVAAFRGKGKPAIAYAETLGEFAPGNGAYYLATAFDRIYLQPSGSVGLTGLISNTSFLRGTLDKLGILPRLARRKEYKTLVNRLTEKKYTEPHREANRSILASLFGQILEGISGARTLPVEEVRSLADRGPFPGKEAVEAKLVDGLAYRDEVYEKVRQTAGEDARFLDLDDYSRRVGSPPGNGETIALIYGVGGIRRGKSRYDPASGRFFLGPDTVGDAFRSAVEDKEVRAILFRVDSPGGSHVASDTIWREVVRAREAGKPVIVSMGNVAGSGGYYISMAADRIVAQPGTLTGSIGVFAGKMVTTSFWEKVGVSWDEVHTGENADMWIWTRDYSERQWERVQGVLDRIYGEFTEKAATGRRMPKEKVLEVAKGRVWTGEDAKALGLVDELGGFPAALRLAREAAGIPPETGVRVKVFPERRPRWRTLLEDLLDPRRGGASESLVRLLETVQPVVRIAEDMGIGPPPGGLTMEEGEQRW